MRAAAIVGPGNTARALKAFERLLPEGWASSVAQADVAIVFGGDGTIHRNLGSLVALDMPLLAVPCGSGNDFARALRLTTLLDALRAWHKFCAEGNNVRSVDLGIIRPRAGTQKDAGQYFCTVAGVGIDSGIIRRADRLPRWLRAHGGYALSAAAEFLDFAPFPMKLSAPGNNGLQPTVLVAFANSPNYGGGMRIAPRAKLDDGMLDVCVVRAMSRWRLLRLFPTVYLGHHLRFRGVEYVQAARLTIETEPARDVFADGEYVCQTPVEVAVAPNALKVVV